MEKDNFPMRLREERERLGLNQEALAEAGGVKKLAQHKYEKGENSPTVAYLQAIASAGVDVVYALTGVRDAVSIPQLAGKHAIAGAVPAPAPASDDDTIYVPLLCATGSMGPGNELLPEDVILGDLETQGIWLASVVGLDDDRIAGEMVAAFGVPNPLALRVFSGPTAFEQYRRLAGEDSACSRAGRSRQASVSCPAAATCSRRTWRASMPLFQ